LTDGIIASDNFQDGSWQGFAGDDLEVIIDLGRTIPLTSISCNFLSDNKSWIFLPKQVTVLVSQDGITYRNLGENKFTADKEIKGAVIQPVIYPVKGAIRYIKLTAINQGMFPAWHPAAGEKPWLFVDEIVAD
jgi:hexosaminidase